MQIIDVDKFDVICVSPRNHFVFTPMLPATAVGSVEPRSLLEPVRLANEYLAYFEANAESIDLEAKTATCMSIVSKDPKRRVEFQVDYDTLFVAVGEVRQFCRTLGRTLSLCLLRAVWLWLCWAWIWFQAVCDRLCAMQRARFSG